MRSDEELLRAYVSSRAEGCFRELVERYCGLVYATCRQCLASHHDAEDACQAVFIVLSRKAADLPPAMPLADWLYRTAHFIAANLRRAAVRRSKHERSANEVRALMPQMDVSVKSSESAAIGEALRALPQDTRRAVVLRYLAGQSHAEVGAALGCSAEGARKRVEAALEKLRERLKRDGLPLSSAALLSTLEAQSGQAAPASLVEHCLVAVSQQGTAATQYADEALRQMRRPSQTIVYSAAVLVLLLVIAMFMHREGRPLTAGIVQSSPAGNSEWQVIALNDDGVYSSVATAINDRGDVGGVVRTAEGWQRAVFWRGGQRIDMGTLGGHESFVNAMDDAGRAVGWAETQRGERRAFLWNSETMQQLETLGGDCSASAINSRGDIVGTSLRPAGRTGLPVLWQNQAIRLLGRGDSWTAQGITADSSIVGTIVSGRKTQAIIWSNGEYKRIPDFNIQAVNAAGHCAGFLESEEHEQAALIVDGRPLPLANASSLFSRALAINAAGVAVGTLEVAPGIFHAVVWRDGVATDLNSYVADPEWVLVRATGINSKGEIAGESLYQGRQCAFLLTRSGAGEPARQVRTSGQRVPQAALYPGVGCLPWPQLDAAVLAQALRMFATQWPAERFATMQVGPFLVVSDMPRAVARRWIKSKLLGTGAAFQRQFLSRERQIGPLLICAFKNYDSYAMGVQQQTAAAPQNVFGQLWPGGAALSIAEDGSGSGTSNYYVLALLIKADFPGVPAWLVDGMAGLFTECHVDPTGRLQALTNYLVPQLQQSIEEGRALSLDELLNMSDTQYQTRFRTEGRQAHLCLSSSYFLLWLQSQGMLRQFYVRVRDAAGGGAVGPLLSLFPGKTVEVLTVEFHRWAMQLKYVDVDEPYGDDYGPAPEVPINDGF